MSLSLSVNGVTYTYPQTGDQSWGDSGSNWAQAVTIGMLQKAGGSFTLSADVDFGASFGLKSVYYKSRASNPASSGIVRLGNAETVSWRNNANGGDLPLTANSSDQLTYNGNPVLSTVGALTASRALATDSGSAITSSATTSTELGYVSGVTSAIQTQLGTKISSLTGDVTASGGGAAAATIAANAVTNAKLAQMATLTIKGNNTGGTANSTDLTVAQTKAMLNIAPTSQKFTTTGSTTGYAFTCTAANATIGATYTNNGNTYTVLSTIAAGILLYTSGAGAPTATGTLTKATGSGDATITFSLAQALATYTTPAGAFYLRVRLVGGGGGGVASGGVDGADGLRSVFGTALLVAEGGLKGRSATGGGGTGGTGTIGAGAAGVVGSGNSGGGGPGGGGTNYLGGTGGGSAFFGGGGTSPQAAAGTAGATNTGGGGAGGAVSGAGGPGGGGGGGVDAIITSPSATYVYCVGTGGAGGAGGNAGGAGAAGIILVEEFYQ